MAAGVVAVTGATGFIGRFACAALEERGFEVRPISRSLGVDLLVAGSEREAVDGCSHLLHLAWCAEPGVYWTSPENADWAEATLRLADAFEGGRMVVAGTCAEEWFPDTPYAVSKRAAREALGDRVGWGRVFFVHGPGEPAVRLVPSVALALLRGEEAKVTEGLQRRDFLHVADLADAFAALCASDLPGVVDLGSGDAPAVREVVRLVAEAVGRPDLVRYGALPTRPGEPEEIRADPARLRSTGWRPRYDLAAGLADTVASLR